MDERWFGKGTWRLIFLWRRRLAGHVWSTEGLRSTWPDLPAGIGLLMSARMHREPDHKSLNPSFRRKSLRRVDVLCKRERAVERMYRLARVEHTHRVVYPRSIS